MTSLVTKLVRSAVVRDRITLTLSLPRVIKIKLPLQPHKKYNITQCGELGFS